MLVSPRLAFGVQLSARPSCSAPHHHNAITLRQEPHSPTKPFGVFVPCRVYPKSSTVYFRSPLGFCFSELQCPCEDNTTRQHDSYRRISLVSSLSELRKEKSLGSTATMTEAMPPPLLSSRMTTREDALILGPEQSHRIIAVLDEAAEKLGFLGSIMPDVLQHRDELSKFVGDEISRIIQVPWSGNITLVRFS